MGLLAALIAPGILASGMFMADVTGYPERAAGMARAGDPAQSPMARSAPMGMLSLLPPSPPTQVPPRPGRPAAGDAGDTAHQGGGMAGTGQGVRTGATTTTGDAALAAPAAGQTATRDRSLPRSGGGQAPPKEARDGLLNPTRMPQSPGPMTVYEGLIQQTLPKPIIRPPFAALRSGAARAKKRPAERRDEKRDERREKQNDRPEETQAPSQPAPAQPAPQPVPACVKDRAGILVWRICRTPTGGVSTLRGEIAPMRSDAAPTGSGVPVAHSDAPAAHRDLAPTPGGAAPAPMQPILTGVLTL